MSCSINTNLAMLAILTASSIAYPFAALAEDYNESSGSTRIQIKRPADLPPLQARVSQDRDLGSINNDDASKLRSIFAQQAGLKPAAFSGNAVKDDSNLRGQTPMLDRFFAGKTDKTNLSGQAQKVGPDNAPYIWCQSGFGGYTDASGNYQGNVSGWRLRELGGKFLDGTPVPKGPVKVNEMGHVWYQNDLNHNSFRTMPGR